MPSETDESAFSAIDSDELGRFPDIGDLSRAIRFSPAAGHIRLFDQRMVLMHEYALGELRAEIVEAVGLARARQIYMRVGYYQGAADAALARRSDQRDGAALFMAGPQLGAIEGWVGLHPTQTEFDVGSGRFHAEHTWPESIEAPAHVARLGTATAPACWQLTGYASGFASEFMGTPILFREVECVAMGHAVCRAIGKPLAAWGELAADAEFLDVDPFVNAVAARPARPQRHRRDTPTAPSPAASTDDSGIVGVSAAFNSTMHRIRKVAPTDTTVLLLGESGVGKEMFARALHRLSRRRDGPLVVINCAAIPESLIEAELFGVEKGAFTGAVAARAGRFERAHGGTLMLDEVGSLAYTAQGKLLRVLQERVLERVGGEREIPIDVRVIAATNDDLQGAVRAGRFRDDLYYRLNVFPIEIQPLRQRRADIPLLMEHFLNRFRKQFDKPIAGYTEAAIDLLYGHAWPGNIRELENLIERAAILVSAGEPIDVHHLMNPPLHAPADPRRGNTDADAAVPATPGGGSNDAAFGNALLERLLDRGGDLQGLEDALLAAAVARTGGNVSAAAQLLGLTRHQLDYRLRRAGGGGGSRGRH
ncbi:MAG: sigma 54-interacting transcriptional regulator [Gammaproteobacteria bacterium]